MLYRKAFIPHILICIAIGLLLLTFAGCAGSKQKITGKYVVLLGEDSEIVNQVSDVDVLVVDAEYFSMDEIAALKENGVKAVYTYFNIGSIENFRTYYDKYEKYTLGEYQNWPEERWIDVSKNEWQIFLAEKIDGFINRGVDGFFVDNTDVYYQYPTDEIYDGILKILSYIKNSNHKMIINGGDYFVTRYLESGVDEIPLFDGVNQENVYTAYDFSKKSYTTNSINDRDYYTDYLDFVQQKGCDVYVLEYANEQSIAKKAYEFSMEHNYCCYVANNIELKMN